MPRVAGDSTITLLADFHNEALALLSAKAPHGASTIRQGMMASRDRLSRNTAGKITKLNISYAVCRHLTKEYTQQLINVIERELDVQDPIPTPDPTLCQTDMDDTVMGHLIVMPEDWVNNVANGRMFLDAKVG